MPTYPFAAAGTCGALKPRPLLPSAHRAAPRPALALAALSIPWLLFGTAPPAAAQTPDSLERCAQIGASPDRLACYDRLAGRAELPSAPKPGAPAAGAPRASSTLAPADTAATQTPEPAAAGGSLLSKYWELDPGDKRGVFNFNGYRPNYVLPVHAANRVNGAPQSPTHPLTDIPDYDKVESKIQISLRTKLVQDVPLIGGDFWAGYTQVSLWQVYNSADSRPFRNNDYEPELMYVTRTPELVRFLPFGAQWRYLELALAHQSNGQSDPLSRSWNRVYFGTGFERGDFSLTFSAQHRLHESAAHDDNPDITHFRGRGDFRLAWSRGPGTMSLLYRSTLKNFDRGALQAEWSYPVFPTQPNGLRWYVQAFSGYAETLTDYNFRQTSVGAGLAFLQF